MRASHVGQGRPRKGDYVIYWMTAVVRAIDDEALEFAITTANEHGVRSLVVFVLDPDYPEAQHRYFEFLVQGLRDVESGIARRNAKFVTRIGDPVEHIVELAAPAPCWRRRPRMSTHAPRSSGPRPTIPTGTQP